MTRKNQRVIGRHKGIVGNKVPQATHPKAGSQTMPRFSPNAPPLDWQRQHDHALEVTAISENRVHGIKSLADPRQIDRIARNRPVPRQASCHYYRRSFARGEFYFG